MPVVCGWISSQALRTLISWPCLGLKRQGCCVTTCCPGDSSGHGFMRNTKIGSEECGLAGPRPRGPWLPWGASCSHRVCLLLGNSVQGCIPMWGLNNVFLTALKDRWFLKICGCWVELLRGWSLLVGLCGRSPVPPACMGSSLSSGAEAGLVDM